MLTKVKQTLPKLSLYILVCTMFGLAVWFNVYAVNKFDQIDEELAPFTSSPTANPAEELENSIQPYPAAYFKGYDPLPTPEPEPLTGPALYLSYVDQITTDLYPDIPADYVKAIIWRESTYNPNCITGDNVGLMQVSMKWDVERAKEMGIDNMFDPYNNIRLGCDILHEYTETYGFSYAINYHSGGYRYANTYKNSTSPVEKQLAHIIEKMKSGEIVVGGE